MAPIWFVCKWLPKTNWQTCSFKFFHNEICKLFLQDDSFLNFFFHTINKDYSKKFYIKQRQINSLLTRKPGVFLSLHVIFLQWLWYEFFQLTIGHNLWLLHGFNTCINAVLSDTKIRRESHPWQDSNPHLLVFITHFFYRHQIS